MDAVPDVSILSTAGVRYQDTGHRTQFGDRFEDWLTVEIQDRIRDVLKSPNPVVRPLALDEGRLRELHGRPLPDWSGALSAHPPLEPGHYVLSGRYWGESASGQCGYANGAASETSFDWKYTGCGDGYERTSPVGSFGPNGFGLHDVLGNVWEWVEDCWHDDYAGAPRDGRAWLGGNGGDCSRRVLRGGSWISHPWDLRAANRSRVGTGGRSNDDGFRVAWTFTP